MHFRTLHDAVGIPLILYDAPLMRLDDKEALRLTAQPPHGAPRAA